MTLPEVDFVLMLITLLFCVFLKLEWGIIIGIILNIAMLLYFSARPSVHTEIRQVNEFKRTSSIFVSRIPSKMELVLSRSTKLRP